MDVILLKYYNVERSISNRINNMSLCKWRLAWRHLIPGKHTTNAYAGISLALSIQRCASFDPT